MRIPGIKVEGRTAAYHCTTRTVAREMLLENPEEETVAAVVGAAGWAPLFLAAESGDARACRRMFTGCSGGPSWGGRVKVTDVRDGIVIEVIQDVDGDIVTAWPANVPKNPE